MTERTLYTSVASEVLTSANFEKMPKGWVAYAVIETNQTNITGETTITGSSVTFTVGEGRLHEFQAAVALTGSNAGDNARIRVYIDSVETWSTDLDMDTTRQTLSIPAMIIDDLSAGSHTIHLTLARATGSGDIDTVVLGHPVVWSLKDIGPAPS